MNWQTGSSIRGHRNKQAKRILALPQQRNPLCKQRKTRVNPNFHAPGLSSPQLMKLSQSILETLDLRSRMAWLWKILPELIETSPAMPVPDQSGAKKRFIGMTVPQLALLGGMFLVEICVLIGFAIIIFLNS